MHLVVRAWLAMLILVLCASAVNAQTFAYSISCAPTSLIIGPDTIQPYSASGNVTLVPNVANNSNTVDLFNNTTSIFLLGHSATFNGTLPCSFTFAGVTVAVNRTFQLVVTFTPGAGAQPAGRHRTEGTFTGMETHSFNFQAFSFNVVVPGQGTLTVSQPLGQIVSTTLPSNPMSNVQANPPNQVLVVPPVSSTLLFVTFLSQTPIPPSLGLTLTGLAAAGLYEIRRRKMAALRGY